MNFGMIILNQNIKTTQNYVILILTALKTDDFYKDIADDVKNRYDTSNYEVRPLPKGLNTKVIDLMKDELGVKIMSLLHLDQKHILTEQMIR